jgi:hypothetical protein
VWADDIEANLPPAEKPAGLYGEIRLNPQNQMTLTQLLQQIRSLPQIIANAAKERQRQTVLNDLEAERLDRIRNPSKYRGK